MQACPRPTWSSSQGVIRASRSCCCRVTQPRKRQRTIRYASTSPTAVNTITSLPSPYQKLHQALKDLAQTAPIHVNPSRIRLALQGLETENAVTRIAILGINRQDNARRLIRLLLADALEDEQSWESTLLSYEASHGFLIRYGQPQNPSLPTRSTLPILYIPSPLLERLNVEFLVGAIAAHQNGIESVPVETFLVPAVGVPTAFDGRQVTVNQPVHHALVTSQGFDQLLSSIHLIAATKFLSESDRHSITIASDLPNVRTPAESQVKVVDALKAEEGLAAIRETVAKATTYEHKWIASGLPQLSQWLEDTAGNSRTNSQHTQIIQLTQSILEATKSSLNEEEVRLKSTRRAGRVDDVAFARTESAIEDFSQAAHVELQAGLVSAWSSRNWTKLSWYKLFWRVDDVGLIVSDLVTNTWLPKTERAAYEICGRLSQLGIDPTFTPDQIEMYETKSPFDIAAEPEANSESLPAVVEVAGTSPANEVRFVAAEPVLQTNSATNTTFVSTKVPDIAQPIATAVSSARNAFLSQQITILTTTAQQLVFRTLSISGMSGGLSVLTYVSQLVPTVYEAGSIFAVGTVFALYRMQSGWQNATKALEDGLFEEGRSVVRRVVTRLGELLNVRRAFEEPDTVELKTLKDGVAALEKVEQAVTELKEKKINS